MLPLLSSIDESEVITLLQAGAGTVLLGCTLLALRHYLRPALTYRLYEHGVRVFDGHHHKERFIPFEKIGDIYRFRGGKALAGCLTSRRSAPARISPGVRFSATSPIRGGWQT